MRRMLDAHDSRLRPSNRSVVFIIHERAKGRMYARVRSDYSGVIRRALETVERGSSQPRAFAGYGKKLPKVRMGSKIF
jgi:hypothetical protein